MPAVTSSRVRIGARKFGPTTTLKYVLSLFRSDEESHKSHWLQNRVTDHRLGLSVKNITAVMEGEGLGEILDKLAAQNRAHLLESALAEI